MINLSDRIDRPELMDTQTFDDAVTRRTLGFLGLTARWFGGARVVTNHFEKWSEKWPPRALVSVLDIGCGGGEIPIAIAEWARSRGFRVHVRAIDIVPEIAAIARENCSSYSEIDVRVEDAFDLAGRGERFDYVTGSLFLHHVPTPQLNRMLLLLDALSRRGVLISDLRRSVPSLVAVTALSLLAGNSVVRHDAPLSVRRSFRPDELDRLASAAGLRYLRARKEPFFRLSLAGEKS